MNCRDLDQLTESRPFGALTDAARRDAESHANGCHHCAPLWVAYARLAAVRVPPMPDELVEKCRGLAAAHSQGSVLRLVPRSMTLAVGGFVVLAAAASAITAHFVSTSAPQRADVADAPLPVVVDPGQPAAPPYAPDIDLVEQGDPDMNASKLATVVAVSAAAVTQAQTPPAEEGPRILSAAEIIARNDLNKDGIVTLAEAAKVNGRLYVMFSSVYDLNHDDQMDVAELEHALEAVEVGTALDKITGQSGGNMAGARPEAIMASNDLDKDGIVTKEEATKAGKALIRLWDSYDLDKDGRVDYADLAKGQGY